MHASTSLYFFRLYSSSSIACITCCTYLLCGTDKKIWSNKKHFAYRSILSKFFCARRKQSCKNSSAIKKQFWNISIQKCKIKFVVCFSLQFLLKTETILNFIIAIKPLQRKILKLLFLLTLTAHFFKLKTEIMEQFRNQNCVISIKKK